MRWRNSCACIAAAQLMLQEAVVGRVQVSAHVDHMLCAQRCGNAVFRYCLGALPAALQRLSHAAEQPGGLLTQLLPPANVTGKD